MSVERVNELPFPCVKIQGSRTKVLSLLAQMATDWLEMQLSLGEEGCLIFDIDDTVVEDNERIIAPIANIFHTYKTRLNYYFVTARPERLRAETVNMLRRLKFDGYKDLMLMKSRKTHDRAVLSYKYGEQKQRW
jgi:ribonucleotide monophosphatase NagD (HAD superfamily)